ncbi:unnamed protein product, partial [Didymodactylos carnosus]
MEQILFENWMPMTVGPFIGSWFAIFVIAILYEGLKTFREYLLRREARREFTETENRRNALLQNSGGDYEPPLSDQTPTINIERREGGKGSVSPCRLEPEET